MAMKLPLIEQIRAAGLPPPNVEHEFHNERRWRFDLCWPDRKLALEVDGGVYTRGRHTRGNGYEEDCRKVNEAQLLGWLVLRVSTGMVASGEALTLLVNAFRDDVRGRV